MPNLVVCFKGVLDEAQLRIDRTSGKVYFEGNTRRISTFDKPAIEEAVRIKEKHGGTVTGVTLGPPGTEQVIREALAMGCDSAVFLSDPKLLDADTLLTSYALAAALRKLGAFDLIICGEASIDGYSGQVGPSIAEWLGIPVVTYATKITVDGGRLLVERLLEHDVEVIEAQLPALVTVIGEINVPRLPTLMQLISATRKKMTTWGLADLGLGDDELVASGPPLRVQQITGQTMERKRVIFEGPPQEVAEKLADAILSSR